MILSGWIRSLVFDVGRGGEAAVAGAVGFKFKFLEDRGDVFFDAGLGEMQQCGNRLVDARDGGANTRRERWALCGHRGWNGSTVVPPLPDRDGAAGESVRGFTNSVTSAPDLAQITRAGYGRK